LSTRAVRLRNLMLLVAIFASLVAAGCWDSRRNMQHVLDEGYSTIVEITGAQLQRLAPFALDGWRPRFVEQRLSVDLKWTGKDGKPHQFKKVPVTEQFASTIVEGDQVKLAIVPAKVLDDEQAVPVIDADAAARFASLQEWILSSAYIAGAAWIGFAAFTVWLARARSAAAVSASPGAVIMAFPPRRTLFGVAALLVGAILAFRAWSLEGEGSGGGAGGIETTAEITSTTALGGASGAGAHVIQLSWKDARGGVHHFGPVHVSDKFWNKITRNGELTVHEARIRYAGQGIDARPSLVDDTPETTWKVEFALMSGISLLVIGAASLVSALRHARRQQKGSPVK
jgi:hypothetical protein